MSNFTIRIAHLESVSPLSYGDIVMPGDPIGVMGSSGDSTGPHVHIDTITGFVKTKWRLSDMVKGIVIPAPLQLNWFIDDEFFKCAPIITTYYYDPTYKKIRPGKDHPAYDLIPSIESKKMVYWNRSMPGEVLFSGYYSGYGNVLHIGFVA